MKNKYIWRLFFYKLIALLPRNVSHYVFFNLQKKFGQVGVKKYIFSAKNFIARVLPSVEKNNFNVGIEIGTGWYPIVPVLFLEERPDLMVYSYDLRELMSTQNYTETLKSLKVDNGFMRNRFYYKSGIDLTNYLFVEVKEEKIFIFSKATLQHIPKPIIHEIHFNLIKRFPSHTIFHLINCNDHRQHTDKTLSKYEFLKYNETQWNRKHTNFDFHNRMRAVEYDVLFKELGYEIVQFTFDHPSTYDLEDFKNNILPKLNSRFQKFSNLENTRGSLFYELKIDKK